MQLIMYQTNSDPKCMRKSLNHIGEVGFFLKGEGSLLELDVLLLISDYIYDCNYVFIPQWNRYYFVERPTVISNEHMSLHLVQDVLQTWAGQLESINAIIVRQENIYDPFIHDNMYKVWTHKFIQSKVLGEFSREEVDSYVVTTTGGIQ